jgi:hypothetical protein
MGKVDSVVTVTSHEMGKVDSVLSPAVFAWFTCQVPPVEKEFVNLL